MIVASAGDYHAVAQDGTRGGALRFDDAFLEPTN